MTKSDVSLRFAEVMNERDNYQSVSLPMILDSSEVIFFYYANAGPEGFVLEKIGDIFFRDTQTSTITVKNPSDLFSNRELEELIRDQVVKGPTGIEALNDVNSYYDLHEQLLERGIEHVEDEMLRAYVGTFSRIVPKGNLRHVYYRVGRPMFQHIADRIGRAQNKE